MRNIVLTIAYDGTSYHGWQYQPNGITVEQVVRQAVERILDHKAKIYAAGRTDAGVHAQGQVVNFFTEKPIDLSNLARGLNSMLPGDIRVRGASEADPSFHARYSARSKTYVYCVLNSLHDSPFHTRYVWHVPRTLEVVKMDKAMKLITGEHDFSAFKKKEEVYHSSVRNVMRARVKRRGDLVYFVIEATGFLRYMVRNIVGTFMLIGLGKITANDLRSILESKDREQAGPTAPAKGLCLQRIAY
ncbi:tRNA pseudouridine(38-40) synthase TruA [Syntrophorhabdus aromaticivorans]|uniref:tRNA pseudouridine synthase A n=1 Tax=Syntrophorhabdus aromaticivorans TaxID=328301 RepID=A0A971M165_9BACT|nr:tRNA pseudouridine(38-40) synthase TruA [Syntrophorhabdus aromaticivorans]NLW33940.1 tRNA pseudouridine(38-40) synthase TruA [Syntrophorhabdus aromaticivorans]